MVRSRRASKARCWTLEFIDVVDVASLLTSPFRRYSMVLWDLAFRSTGGEVRSAKPDRPSRRKVRPTTDVLYLPKDPKAERRGRAAHGNHMNLIRVASRGHGRKCASSLIFCMTDPTF